MYAKFRLFWNFNGFLEKKLNKGAFSGGVTTNLTWLIYLRSINIWRMAEISLGEKFLITKCNNAKKKFHFNSVNSGFTWNKIFWTIFPGDFSEIFTWFSRNNVKISWIISFLWILGEKYKFASNFYFEISLVNLGKLIKILRICPNLDEFIIFVTFT